VVNTWVKSVATMNGMKLTSNGKFLKTGGQAIPNKTETGENVVFYFRPTTVEILPVTEGGVQTYKAYARGIITMNQQSEDGTTLAEYLGIPQTSKDWKWANTRDVFVPLEDTGIKGLIDGKNVMTNFYNKLDELNSGGSSRSGGGGYSSAQEAGIKNVMNANNISREEAIQALKDAGKL
jgi:hypothetical protein